MKAKSKMIPTGAEIKSILKKGEKTDDFPSNLEPMLATLVAEPVEGTEWEYEMKWDGYRCIAYIKNGSVDLCSRNNKSFNQKFYPVHQSLAKWPVNAVIDGEIVVLNEHGIPDFSDLQL